MRRGTRNKKVEESGGMGEETGKEMWREGEEEEKNNQRNTNKRKRNNETKEE